MVRKLVFLDADNASNLGELCFVPIQGRDVDGRDLDREVFVGGLGLSLLLLWSLLRYGVFFSPVRVEVCFFAGERGLRISGRPRFVYWDCW